MEKSKLENVFYAVIEAVAEKNFCPKQTVCPAEHGLSRAECIKCISDYVVSSSYFTEEMANEIFRDKKEVD